VWRDSNDAQRNNKTMKSLQERLSNVTRLQAKAVKIQEWYNSGERGQAIES
jgi:hypothetical protein